MTIKLSYTGSRFQFDLVHKIESVTAEQKTDIM